MVQVRDGLSAASMGLTPFPFPGDTPNADLPGALPRDVEGLDDITAGAAQIAGDPHNVQNTVSAAGKILKGLVACALSCRERCHKSQAPDATDKV